MSRLTDRDVSAWINAAADIIEHNGYEPDGSGRACGIPTAVGWTVPEKAIERFPDGGVKIHARAVYDRIARAHGQPEWVYPFQLDRRGWSTREAVAFLRASAR